MAEEKAEEEEQEQEQEREREQEEERREMLRAEPSSPRAAGPPSVAPPPHPPRAAQGTPAAGPRHDGLRAGLWRDAAGQPAGKPGARRLPRGWPTSCWRTPVSRGAKWDQPLCGPPLARVLGRESRVGGRQKRTSARNIREQQVTADRELNPSGMARERQPSRWHRTARATALRCRRAHSRSTPRVLPVWHCANRSNRNRTPSLLIPSPTSGRRKSSFGLATEHHNADHAASPTHRRRCGARPAAPPTPPPSGRPGLSDKRETRALAAAAGHKFGGRARAPRAGSQGPRRGQRWGRERRRRRGGDREEPCPVRTR
ncbi:unnamed protein product [Prorocentrum cordatum]|uniref:Uncharacterized protein n=1 Tax=Prorocentrum cordatum TaxID=2364126 RepID=A0ABN9XNL0_9DINO|nr:unnamed protein product [Polarella glacialis]